VYELTGFGARLDGNAKIETKSQKQLMGSVLISSAGCFDEPGHQIGQFLEPIETVRDFGQIAPLMVRLASVIRSVDRTLDVALEGVRSALSSRSCLAASGDLRLVLAASRMMRAEAGSRRGRLLSSGDEDRVGSRNYRARLLCAPHTARYRATHEAAVWDPHEIVVVRDMLHLIEATPASGSLSLGKPGAKRRLTLTGCREPLPCRLNSGIPNARHCGCSATRAAIGGSGIEEFGKAQFSNFIERDGQSRT